MKGLLTNGLGERRALAFSALSGRQQVLWNLLPGEGQRGSTAGELRLDHGATLDRHGYVGLRAVLGGLAVLETAGWAQRNGGAWSRRTPTDPETAR